jgi:hypothetical protein
VDEQERDIGPAGRIRRCAVSSILPPAPARSVDWPDPLPPQLSPSSITTFLTCPEQWRRRYVLGQRERSNASLLIGRADSKARELNLGQKIVTGLDMGLGLVQEIAADAFTQGLEEEGGAGEVDWKGKKDEEPMTPGSAKDMSVKVATAYRQTVSELVRPVAVEQEVTVEVPGIVPVVHGYIDVTEAGSIRECKTSNKAVNKPKGNWLAQTLLYSAAHGNVPVTFDVSVKRLKGPAEVLSGSFKPELVAHQDGRAGERLALMTATVVESIVALLEKRGPDNVWPGVGAIQLVSPCGWCDFAINCPWFLQ